MIRYAFDSSGGFAAVDDERRVGAYAFPTSDNARAAVRLPETTARAMVKGWPGGSAIREDLYQRMTSIIYMAERIDCIFPEGGAK